LALVEYVLMTLVLAILQENLHTLISTDLEYLNAWSCRWLVKFNPNKTYIMIFSTRHLENNSIFDFNDISLSPVQICQ
jgi:membrane-associated PAP2 superfamily phosphatase